MQARDGLDEEFFGLLLAALGFDPNVHASWPALLTLCVRELWRPSFVRRP